MIYQDDLNWKELERYAVSLNTRAKQLGTAGELNAVLLRHRILESGGRCEWCGVSLVNEEFELDHVVSLSQRGRNLPRNLAVACVNCNRRKSYKHPARFAAEIYSETHVKTPLVAAVLERHGIEPIKQTRLFEKDEPAVTHIELDEDRDSAAPYIWSEYKDRRIGAEHE